MESFARGVPGNPVQTIQATSFGFVDLSFGICLRIAAKCIGKAAGGLSRLALCTWEHLVSDHLFVQIANVSRAENGL